MEIEAKFQVAEPRVFSDLLQLSRIGSFDLIPIPCVEHQLNTYFDTVDRRLAEQRYSLRVRNLGDRRIATVKRSLGTHMAIHTREEWQVELTAGDYPTEWPESAARDQALAVLAGAAVIPLFSVRTNRQYMHARQTGRLIAELSLDEGWIMAGKRVETFRELEIELQPAGTRVELDALIALLQARFALIAQAQGKRTRGLALLKRVNSETAASTFEGESAYIVC